MRKVNKKAPISSGASTLRKVAHYAAILISALLPFIFYDNLRITATCCQNQNNPDLKARRLYGTNATG